MAQIIRVDGTLTDVEPENGTDFKLEELKDIVGGYIEIIDLPRGMILVIDEEGKCKDKPHNPTATVAFQLTGRKDWIAGDVLLCRVEQVK